MEEKQIIRVVYGKKVVCEKDVTGKYSEDWWLKRCHQFSADLELIELVKELMQVTFHFELTRYYEIQPIVRVNTQLVRKSIGNSIRIEGLTLNRYIEEYTKKGSPSMISFHDDVDETWEVIGSTEDKIIPAHYEDTYDWICEVTIPAAAEEWARNMKSFHEYMIRKLRREGKDWYKYSMHPLHAYPLDE